MLMGYYYGSEEVEILFRRFYMAKDTTKEKVKKYILDGEYELDEESFLHLLTYDLSTMDDALKYYENLDTAAREYFVMILNQFDDEMFQNALSLVLSEMEISTLFSGLAAQREKINFLLERANGLNRVEKELNVELKKINTFNFLISELLKK